MDIDALIDQLDAEQRHSLQHQHEDVTMSHGVGHAAAAAAAAAAVTNTAGTPAAPASQPGAAAAAATGAQHSWPALFKHARELERQIKNTRPAVATTAAANGSASSKADYAHEKQLFTLRRSLRCTYSTLIAVDLFESSHHDVEQLLWKSCIYKQIESLRKLMRTATPTAQATSRRYAQQLARFAKLCAFVRVVLKDCMAFYERLFFAHLPHTGWEAVARGAPHMQSTRANDAHADAAAAAAATVAELIDSSDEEEAADQSTAIHFQPQPQQPVSPRLRLSRIQLHPLPSSASSPLSPESSSRQVHLASCHRCLIFRGDLERYYLLMLRDETAIKLLAEHRRVNAMQVQQGLLKAISAHPSQQWQRVRRFYRLAITLVPELGNPFNQLAVLDTYEHDPLAAVYHYFRALSAVAPFPTAKLNVELLLEKRRDSTLLQAHAQQHGANATRPSPLFPGRSVCAFLQESPMDALWVQLFDLLFNKHPHPHAAALPCVAAAALHRFAAFVSQPSVQPPSSFPRRSVYSLRLLLNLLYCAQHARSTDSAAPASQHCVSKDHNSMCDDESESGVGLPDAATPLTLHTTSLALCFELVRLVASSISSVRSDRIGVVCALLSWIRAHPRVLQEEAAAAAVPAQVQQEFFRGIARLLNTAAEFMASHRPHVAHAQGQQDAGEALFEESEVRGCALFLSPSQAGALAHSSSSSSSSSGASPLLGQPTSAVASEAPEDEEEEEEGGDDMDREGAQQHSSPAERRCAKLLRLGSWMAARGIGLAREPAAPGRFRAMHDPPSSGLAAAAASPVEDAAAAMEPTAAAVAPFARVPIVPVFPQSATPDRAAHVSPFVAALPPSPPRNQDPLQFPAGAIADVAMHHQSPAPPRDRAPAANEALASASQVQRSPPHPDALDGDCAMSDEHDRVHEQNSAAVGAASSAAAAAAAPTVAAVEQAWSVSAAARAAGLDLAASYSRLMFPSFGSSFAAPSVPLAAAPGAAQ